METKTLFGRRKIFTAAVEINKDNIIKELAEALEVHVQNLFEMNYLYAYRRGRQPILDRVKEIRPEICNKVVVNNANQVVVFKNGYFLTKPAHYVSRRDNEQITEKISELNEYLYTSGKHQVDNEVIDWFHTVGLGALLVEPNRLPSKNTPVKVYSLDPRSAFVVYSLRPGNRPMMGVNMVVSGDRTLYDVFTDESIFRLSTTRNNTETLAPDIMASALTLDAIEKNEVGLIPIIEYQYNESRMSAFEPAIPIMDAINNVESNRIDGVEQQVQQLCVAYNCNFDEEVTANEIRQAGMLQLRSIGENKADFKILDSTLDQTSTQTTIDDLYEQMLDKCGMPSSVHDSGSTSDNVGAVYLRNGWAMADTQARNTEDLFKKSNALFDEVFLRILSVKAQFDIEQTDFELKIPRNDTNNLLVKTQAALNMKQLGFAPQITFERSGLSNDPLNDIEQSKEYIEKAWTTQEETVDVVDETSTLEGGQQ